MVSETHYRPWAYADDRAKFVTLHERNIQSGHILSVGFDRGRAAEGRPRWPVQHVTREASAMVRPRSRAELSLAVQAREAFWLQQVREGKATKEIAGREGLSRRRVQQGISRATLRERESRLGKSRAQDVTHRMLQELSREASPKTGKGAAVRSPLDDPRYPPRLVPLFPIGPLTPQSTCPHHGPMRPGSVFCCMVCSQSGMDDHPALKRDPSTDPPPSPSRSSRPLLALADVRRAKNAGDAYRKGAGPHF